MSPKHDEKPGSSQRRTQFKKLLFVTTSVLIIGLIWVGWPIYGFLSNQYETARLPWGWQTLPKEMPKDEVLLDSNFAGPGKAAMGLLEDRRAKIGAPSLSAAIAIDGELVWAGAVGWSDVENRIPVSYTHLTLPTKA